jgi:chromosome partitioning protein
MRHAVAVMTVLNQKGGVGKTSTCHHLSGTLALLGQRVLLVDNDPQASLTQGFFGPIAARGLDPATTIAAVLAGELPEPSRLIRPTGIAGVDLLPASGRAASYNVPDPHLTEWDTQVALRDFLAELRGTYDLVMIDCPPNLHLCSWSALVASDCVLVPLQPEDYGAQGIADVQASISRVQSGPNPNLKLLGFLITMRSARRTVHQLFEENLRSLYGEAVFRATVPAAPEFPEAIMKRLTIAAYKPRGAPAKAIRALADELLERLLAMGTTEGTGRSRGAA